MAGFSADRKYVTLARARQAVTGPNSICGDSNNTQLDDKIEWSKFGGTAWYNDGFFYSRFDEPGKIRPIPVPATNKKCITTNWVPNNRQMNWCTATVASEKDISSAVPQMMNISCSYMSEGTSGTGILWRDLTSNDKNCAPCLKDSTGSTVCWIMKVINCWYSPIIWPPTTKWSK